MNVTFARRKLLLPVVLPLSAYVLATTEGVPAWPVAVMASLALALHFTNTILREAEHDSLRTTQGLHIRDILARICMVVFDVLLIFGLILHVGLRMSWDTALYYGAGIVLIMPLVIFFMDRRHLTSDRTPDRLGLPHLGPPVLLAILIATLAATNAVVVPQGSQPYVMLILLSSVFSATRTTTTYTDIARIARYATLAGTLVLLIWNYANTF